RGGGSRTASVFGRDPHAAVTTSAAVSPWRSAKGESLYILQENIRAVAGGYRVRKPVTIAGRDNFNADAADLNGNAADKNRTPEANQLCFLSAAIVVSVCGICVHLSRAPVVTRIPFMKPTVFFVRCGIFALTLLAPEALAQQPSGPPVVRALY